MTTYKVINLVKRPGRVGPELFELVQKELPELNDGQVLIRQTAMSLDPAMLGWMSADTESYIPPVALGEVMRSSGVGLVEQSRNERFKVGDKVMGMFGWQEYIVTNGQGVTKMDKSLSDDTILAVLSTPGLTAAQGLYNIGKPKAGETLVVSGAAGSVGSMVGQMAKAEGLRVVGVAGSDEKCEWLVNELGFDAAINYKKDDLEAQLAAATPNGVDIYFENTGGPIQGLVFERMNTFGRLIVCGMIADYTKATPAPGPNWIRMIKKRLTIQGFAIPDHLHEAPQLIARMLPLLQQGKLKYRTHELHGLESAMTGLVLLFTGENQGKLLVRL